MLEYPLVLGVGVGGWRLGMQVVDMDIPKPVRLGVFAHGIHQDGGGAGHAAQVHVVAALEYRDGL